MLRTLTVDNYALIEHLEMELGGGLNIVTGETGAGKSILLGALGLLLGTRSEAGVQGDPGRACVVEGVFAVEGYGLEAFFEENDLDYADQTTVRRVISASGKSRAYVNDLPVGLAVLRELADRLIDIHSQHENLLLKGEAFRMSVVDTAAGQNDLVARYGEEYRTWRRLEKELAAARAEVSESRRDEDWLRHQADELASLKLRAGEGEALEAEQRELAHSDEIREAIGLCASELGADEGGVVQRVKYLRQVIERVRKTYPRAAEFAERLGSTYLELHDMERELASEYERVPSDPARLDVVSARLDTIWDLQRKHRVQSVEQLIDTQRDFEARLAAIDSSDDHLAGLAREVSEHEQRVRELAARLSEGRRRAAVSLGADVEKILGGLGMAENQFVVEVSPAGGVAGSKPAAGAIGGGADPAAGSGGAKSGASGVSCAGGGGGVAGELRPGGVDSGAGELRPSGADEVRFLFTANASVAPRPIEKIASGGEISRVMLALKTLSARASGRPTVVFDEIDAGVSGRVADAMGEVIARLADGCQVLNITHLPQIAAGRGEHFLVYKEGGATRIRKLTDEERVREIAGMLSGNVVTDAALQHARQLLTD